MAHPLAMRIVATGAVMLFGWIAAKTLHRAPTGPRPNWTAADLDKQVTAQVALLEQAFDTVVDRGVHPRFAANAIGILLRHIHRGLPQHEATVLSLQLVVETVVATDSVMWSSRNAGHLLIALQKELDSTDGIASPYLQKVIAMVREGKTRSEILSRGHRLAIPKPPPF